MHGYVSDFFFSRGRFEAKHVILRVVVVDIILPVNYPYKRSQIMLFLQ